MSNKKQQLLVLAQSIEQPRIIKRIIEKSQEYHNIEVYGFSRQIHEVNNYEILKDYQNINLNIIGSFTDNKYLGRIKGYIKLIKTIYKKHGLKHKQLYVFGLDLRLLSTWIFNSKIDYEISDIMWLYKSPFQKFLLIKIDMLLAKYSNSVTFTSRGFYDVYYSKFVIPKKVIIKENKFKTYGKVNSIDNIISDTIRIAYIGAFRYTKIIENLIKTVTKNKKLLINFYGDGNTSIVDFIEKNTSKHKNIFFHGAFKNPDDLEKIYSENNINFVVYDNTLDNEKVAMPNKFYESGFFNIPIVCAENTYVGMRVLEQNMGWTIGIDYEDISSFLNELQIEDIIKQHNEIKKLNKFFFQC